MKTPVRVLNMFTIMDRGGAETMVMNYYRNIDRNEVQFDFMVHREQRGVYDDEIEALGGRIFRMCPIYPQNFSSYKRMLKQFFDEHTEYKIIHSHMSELGCYAFIEAEKHGVPVRICHAHNAPNGFDFKMIMRNYFKTKMMPHITHMFTCGKDSADWLFGKKNEEHFIQMNNAINTRSFSYNEDIRRNVREQLLLENKLVIGHVGRLTKQKNHKFLIDVYEQIEKKEHESVLLLIGIGELEEEIKEYVKAKGLEEKIRFLGSRGDIDQLMQAMDVFLFPSLFEGFGIVLIEAQAAGLPCVISDRIPQESKVIHTLIRQENLSDSPAMWADIAIELFKNTKREDQLAAIVNNGFEVTEQVKWLQNFYLNSI